MTPSHTPSFWRQAELTLSFGDILIGLCLYRLNKPVSSKQLAQMMTDTLHQWIHMVAVESALGRLHDQAFLTVTTEGGQKYFSISDDGIAMMQTVLTTFASFIDDGQGFLAEGIIAAYQRSREH